MTDDAMECQPINRAIKENLSYSQTQAIYDKAFCSGNMSDFTHNLIRAQSEFEHLVKTIPGVSVVGVKGNPEHMYQRYFPFALFVQAVISYTPVLLWLLWATEELVISIKYIARSCQELIDRSYHDGNPVHGSSSPVAFARGSDPEVKQKKWGEIECQIDEWLDQKFLSRLYITKLVINDIILILFLMLYFMCDVFNISHFKPHFICRVENQSLVTCTLPIVKLYKMIWYANIAIIDCCIMFTTFQFLYILCFMLRPKHFFFLTYMDIGGDSHVTAITDAHVISYFCYQNLRYMPPDILVCKAARSKISKTASSTLISFGESVSELSDNDSPFYSASNTPQGVVKKN